MKNEKLMEKVTIIGVGLIGGSLALSFRRCEGLVISGYDEAEDVLRRALDLGVIDQGTSNLQEAVRDSDVIFIATPVQHITRILDELFRMPMKPGCIISDTGSTKASIMEWVKGRVPPGCYFIGGHPMAGSHRSGVEAASVNLFENAYYVLTPPPELPGEVLEKFKRFMGHTRAKIIELDPRTHDRVVGAISHFPHVVAAALVHLVERYNQESPLYYLLAAGGFRDITRIASSNPEMWRDILLTNKEEILRLFRDWSQAFAAIGAAIEKEDAREIYQFFDQARKAREQIPDRRRGALFTQYDVFVDVPDHPGVIARITSILAEAHLNLSNIEIMENREEVLGVLRLTFRRPEEADRAYQVLQKNGYRVHQIS